MTLNRTFFLLTLAFFAAATAIAAVAVAVLSSESRSSALIVAGVSAAISGAILWSEGRRDLDAVLSLLIGIFGITSAVVGIYILAALNPGVFAKSAAVLTAIVAVACVVVTYRRQKNESTAFPNILAKNFPSGQIFESEGIQFTGYLTPGTRTRPHFASILLQNCFDSSREIVVRLDGADRAKYLRFPTPYSLELGPAEVARVNLPVVARTALQSYDLFLSISVRRTAGRRVRLWRAQEASNRTTTTETVALAALGVIKWGGGVRLTVGPLPEDIWTAPLPPVSSESVWQPAARTAAYERLRHDA